MIYPLIGITYITLRFCGILDSTF